MMARTIHTSLLCVLLAAALHSSAAAQTPLRIDRGTRLRVSLEDARRSVVATLVEVKPDTLVLGRTYGTVESTIPFAVSRIRKLEVWAGKKPSLAPIGAVGGMLLGAALVASYNSIVFSQCFSNCPSSRTSPWIGAGIGGLLGGVSLAFVRPDRWLEISVPVGPSRQ